MTDKARIHIVVLVAFSLLMAGPLTGSSKAADCKALEMAIRNERSLINKQTMIADAVKACPNDASIMYQEGYSYERLRKYEEAIQSYKKAIGVDPAFAKAYFSIGDIQMLLKNYKEASSFYKQGLKYEPDDGRAKASLQEAQIKLGVLTGTAAVEPPPAKPAEAPAAASKKVEPKKVAEAPAAVAKPKRTASAAEAPIMRLQVPFYKKTSDLSQDAKDVLGVVVGQAMNREDMSDVKYEVGGHTDNLGDASKNYEVSKERANNVQKYLKDDFGISADRLKVAYHGEKKPRVPNSTPSNQELNRRVEFTKIE